MKKKALKIFSIFAGIVFLLFLVGNFGLNLWLKKKLPDFIKNNSEYIITYKTLDVHLGTGNIFSTGITINNQNPNNLKNLGLQGTVDSLSISSLGIYDLLFKKKISTTNLRLKNPNLNIILDKPIDEKTGKKKNLIRFENIKISNGNIQIFRPTKQKILSVKALDLMVKNLKLIEKSADKKLPFVFDKYDIKAKNLFYRPDNVYAFTAQSITTTDGQMKVKAFAMIPLLSYQNFLRYHPTEQNLFDVKANEISFKDIILKKNQIALRDVKFENPELKIWTTNAQAKKEKKSFNYAINWENTVFNNGKIDIRKPDETPLFTAENLTMQISKLEMNEQTAKENIPFKYEGFNIKGKQINYVSENENYKIGYLAIQPKQIDLQHISVKPTSEKSKKTSLDLTALQLYFKINNWGFIDNKLKLDIENIFINQLNGVAKIVKNPQKKKPTFAGIEFPLTVKNVVIKNSNVEVDSDHQPLVFKDLNANFQNIELNAETIKEEIPFKTGNYSLTTRNFKYKTKFYNLSATLLKLNKNALQVSNFAMKPTVSRAQYIRMIPTEKDLYDLKINQLNATGKWDLISKNKYLDVGNLTINTLNAEIFRSKIPKDDLSEKPMYSKLLRSIKFPVFVQNLDVKNSLLVYEEDTKKSDGPGKLTFNNFNLDAKNLNSAKMKGKPTQVLIAIQCRFMNASPMNVKWTFDTANRNDAFAISGNVADLPAARINPFIEPYLKIRATGLISDLIFHFKGTQRGINGNLTMVRQDLKISILKQSGEKDKILSTVANLFVKSNSGNRPETVLVDEVERDKSKSFFNLFWRGIELGLKKTLLGKNAPKTEQSIKNTVGNTKSALKENKKDLEQTKKEVKQKVEKAKEKGVFRNLIKKKSDSKLEEPD